MTAAAALVFLFSMIATGAFAGGAIDILRRATDPIGLAAAAVFVVAAWAMALEAKGSLELASTHDVDARGWSR